MALQTSTSALPDVTVNHVSKSTAETWPASRALVSIPQQMQVVSSSPIFGAPSHANPLV